MGLSRAAIVSLSEADYLERLEQLVEQLNGIGQAEEVRNWLQTTRDKPRLGKALSFALPDQAFE